MALGEKIKILRKENKLSQQDVAEKLHIHFKHLGKYERDQVVPPADILKKLADMFKVTTDYLLYDNVPRNGKYEINDMKLFEKFKAVERFEDKDKEAVERLIDAMITKNKVEEAIGTR